MKVLQGQTQLTCPRIKQDPRIKYAWEVYNSFDNDWAIIYKTTRAGCTTGLVSETLNRYEQGLIVVPTNHIADKTVVADSKKYSDREESDIIHIPSNHSCLINEQIVEQYPDLNRLPILPLADKCTECQMFSCCPVTDVLHGKGKDCIVLTYKKLAALMFASGLRPNTMAEQIINKLVLAKNIIFDEIHEMQYGDSTSLTVYNTKLKGKCINIDKYNILGLNYKYITSYILQFKQFYDDIKTQISILQAYQGAESEDYWKHKLSITLENQYNEVDFITGCDKNKAVMGAYNDIIEITKNREHLDLEMYDILQLYDIMAIITSKKIVIHSIRNKGNINVNFVTINDMYINMIKSFVMSIQNKANRVFLTSATICSHDYDSYFMAETRPKKLLFGPGGDPMNTNSKMLILADSKKYSSIGRESRYNKFGEIAKKIEYILNLYGVENCVIIAISLSEAKDIRKYLENVKIDANVTYYKAPDTVGVSSDARVIIAVGAAEKPTNTYDAIADSKLDSLVLREEALHCDTWQAWSRVKDPQGKEHSLVFALGCNEKQCENIVKWGYNRKVEIEMGDDGMKRSVGVECGNENITRPMIIKTNDFYDMLDKANIHRTFKKDLREIETILKDGNNSPINNNNIGDFMPTFRIVYNVTKFDLLKHYLATRFDTFAEQNFNGTQYFRQSVPLTDKIISNHIEGKITVGSYSTSSNGTCKWLCFDIDAHKKEKDTEEEIIQKENKAEDDLKKMKSYLDITGFKYLVESSGSPHSYHIWIFIEEVEVEKAYYFANAIAKEAGVDCEVNPKQRSWNKDNQYGNLVKLPFALHKKHNVFSYVHGWEGESTDIAVYDISAYKIPEKRQRKKNRNIKTLNIKMNGIRPCIISALNKQLTGEQGNKMRVAIVREFYTYGMKDREELIDLFKLQDDFKHEKTGYYVDKIIERDYPIWRKSTLLEKCNKFVNCDTCDRIDCRESE